MSVLMVRARVREDRVSDVEESAQKMFAAIEQESPGGVRYASCKAPDGVTFVAILELEADDDNPLAGLPAFQQFQTDLKDRLAEPPIAEPLQIVGSYRLFS